MVLVGCADTNQLGVVVVVVVVGCANIDQLAVVVIIIVVVVVVVEFANTDQR